MGCEATLSHNFEDFALAYNYFCVKHKYRLVHIYTIGIKMSLTTLKLKKQMNLTVGPLSLTKVVVRAQASVSTVRI